MTDNAMPEHIQPILNIVYDALEQQLPEGIMMVIVRTQEDLAFVTNAQPEDIKSMLTEMLANLDRAEEQ